MMRTFWAVLVVVAAIVLFWYAAAVPMNIKTALTQAEREGAVISPEGAAARRDIQSPSFQP